MHFCIECNGKSLKFDTIAKITVTCASDFRVTKICYVYTYDLRKKEIKTGGHRSYKKMGGRSKSKNWRQNTVFVKIGNILKKSLQDMIVSLTQAMHFYMVCKNMTCNMASAFI